MSSRSEAMDKLFCSRSSGEGNSILASIIPKSEGLPETNPASVFRPVDIGTLLAEPEEDIPWIIDGYLAQGAVTLLAGPPKIGKTTLAYHFVTHVATGQPLLNRVAWKAKVLVLALEEHRRDVVRRFRDSGKELAEHVKVYTRPLPFTEEILDEIVAFIEREEIGFVLVDTLHAWWGLNDENSAAEVIKAGGLLLKAVRRTTAAWLCLVHTRKSGGEHGQEIRGSTALLGLVDVALSMKRTEGGGAQRCLEAVSRYEETPSKIIIGLGERGYEALGSPEEVCAEGKAEKVRAALTEKGQTVEELSKVTGLTQRDVKRFLPRLGKPVVKEGAGVKHDPYRYRHHSIPATSHSREVTLPETNQPETEEVLTDAD